MNNKIRKCITNSIVGLLIYTNKIVFKIFYYKSKLPRVIIVLFLLFLELYNLIN